MLEMLLDFDEVMKKNDIYYVLDSGTAIGAVREHGFIPWDDDIDVAIMSRDIPRFIKAFDDLPEGKYFLQRPYESIDYPQEFYKIRMNNTAFIEGKFQHSRAHLGVFIDILPLYDLPDSRIRRGLFNFDLFLLNICRVLGFSYIGKPRLDPLQRLNNKIFFAINKIMDWLPEKDCKQMRLRIPHFDTIYDKKDYISTVDVMFEGHMLPLNNGYDSALRAQFGDYMTPPPESERVATHSVYCNLNEDYSVWISQHNKK